MFVNSRVGQCHSTGTASLNVPLPPLRRSHNIPTRLPSRPITCPRVWSVAPPLVKLTTFNSSSRPTPCSISLNSSQWYVLCSKDNTIYVKNKGNTIYVKNKGNFIFIILFYLFNPPIMEKRTYNMITIHKLTIKSQ